MFAAKTVCAYAVAVFCALAFAASPAVAAGKGAKAAANSPAEQAKALSAQALVAYESGKYPEAAEMYRLAYRLDPSAPDYLFGFGKAEQKAGRWAQAKTAFEQLLAIVPATDPLAVRARKALADVEAAAAPAPVPAAKPPVVKAEIPVVKPEPPAAAHPAESKVAAPVVGAPVVGVAAAAQAPETSPNWPKWTATIVTGAAAIGAGAFALMANKANSDADAFRIAGAATFDPAKIGEADAKAKITDINGKWTTAAVLGGVAVVGAGVSAYLWLRTPGPTVATDGRQVLLAWNF